MMTVRHTSPAVRAVLLGASNLTLAWPRIMRLLQSRFAGPLDIYTAQGLGRSYVCDRSSMGLRQLPGILASELWQTLPAAMEQPVQTMGLLTDFGNDLLYGRRPEDIVRAAETVVERLRERFPECHLVVTRPPLQSVQTLGALRFVLSRTVLFPLSRLKLQEIKIMTDELDAGLCQLAKSHQVPLFQPRIDWYGIDPIHVRYRFQETAFAEMMKLWPDISIPPEPNSHIEHHSTEHCATDQFAAEQLASGRRPTPGLRWLAGKPRRVAQPVVCSERVRVHAW
jgi:hypothetical protein